MSRPSESTILDALKSVDDPVSGRDLVAAGAVKSIAVENGKATVILQVDPSGGKALEDMRQRAEAAVDALDDRTSATVILTAERAAGTGGADGYPGAPPTQRHGGRPAAPRAADTRGPVAAQGGGDRRALLPEVTHVIAVASGKGGVGKSTTAVNLAVALAQSGLAVGLFDADVFGPSVPRLTGLDGKPQSNDGGKTIEPMEAHGLKIMSIGFLVPEDQATVWRGPMVMGALEQLLRDVNWGALDVVVIDMPPGTGDTQLTISPSPSGCRWPAR